MAKTNRCVVRNQAYRRGEFSMRERHNERKNLSYGNGDIVPERSALNVLFKSCEGTYEQEFSHMVESGAISLRGLKTDAKVFDELVFDVNSAYFENHGGYEYAKEFFAEAYKLAVQEAGGEEYVLSANLHADERNKALSEQFGRDVFHYHLHVIYVPVVDKEIYFKKNNKNPELAGKLKEVVKQVSHSKKWPRFKDENGYWINSYSLLQDRFFEHMRAAGFTDFERGERGSTAEHLTVLEYKTRQEEERAAALGKAVMDKQNAADVLDQQTAKKKKQLDGLDKKITVAEKAAATVSEIEHMADKRTMLGAVPLSQNDWQTVSSLAIEGLKSRDTIKDLRDKNAAQSRAIADMQAKLKSHGDGIGIKDTMRFYQAQQRAPSRMDEIIADIMCKPPEQPQIRTIAKEKRHTQEH